MSAFLSAVDEFIAAIRGQTAWVEELNELSRKVARHFDRAKPAEVDEALHRYAGLVPDAPLVAVGLVGLNCGSLVERGGDTGIAGPALLDKLPRVLETATDFYRRCRAAAEADPDLAAELKGRAEESGEEYDLDALIADESWDGLAQRYGPALYKEAPAVVLGHMSEHMFGLGVIAHLSRSKPLRAAARRRPELFAAIRAADDAAGRPQSFLAQMLQVLDDEPLVALHPGQGKGYRLTMSGVADNFQLHTLLMGTLIGNPAAGWLKGDRPGRDAVAACTTGLADRNAPIVSGQFNLWNWTGVRPDGTLPEGTDGNEHWVWNEGVPADIRPFEGQRVVVLGPAPYSRTWRAGRTFGGLAPELTVEEQLSPAAVQDWLGRLATAPRPGGG